jgi:hypothetical protein
VNTNTSSLSLQILLNPIALESLRRDDLMKLSVSRLKVTLEDLGDADHVVVRNRLQQVFGQSQTNTATQTWDENNEEMRSVSKLQETTWDAFFCGD